jgi:hypothetical protein
MKLSTAIAIAFSLSVIGPDDGKPIFLEEGRVTSPDGQAVAIVESVDNGLGLGQGINR